MSPVDFKIFKAYDIRGIVPSELNEEIAYEIGKALVQFMKPKEVCVGMDMRISSKSLSEGLKQGITESGADVIDIGLVSTDGLYFAVGKFKFDAGVMITASHNPPEYNGMKLCKRDAVPLSGEAGLKEIKEIIKSKSRIKFGTEVKSRNGKVIKKDISKDYTEHVLSFIDLKKIVPFKIVIDAGNGMAGKIIPEIFNHLPCKVIPMYFELDGTFPNHIPNPIEEKNVALLQKKILEEKAEIGAAFDGDADRLFLVDENAKPIGGDILTALVAKNLLLKEPGATILYNAICSRCVLETIEEGGGRPIRTKVGHALIKPLMKQHNAVFGGEHSGHFYFRDNWFADSGLIALLVVLELLSEEKRKISEIVADIDHYYRSGEINSKVSDIPKTLERIKEKYKDGNIDTLDGVTVDYDSFWFNVRPSNTEPLIRLNLEACDFELMRKKTEEVLAVIRQENEC